MQWHVCLEVQEQLSRIELYYFQGIELRSTCLYTVDVYIVPSCSSSTLLFEIGSLISTWNFAVGHLPSPHE